MKIQSVNPYTREVIHEFDAMTSEKVGEKIARSREAFVAWREVPTSKRAGCIANLAAHLRQAKRQYAETITAEMGKPVKESIAEVEKCAWLCDYYAENAERFLTPEEIAAEAKKSYVMFQPLGIVLAVMPWNFPFWQAFRFGIPAIAAGNVVVLKHASNVPMCALAIEEAFREAGFPEGIFTTLLIGAVEALRLIDGDLVDAVSLTGSNRAGAAVAAAAGKRIKKVVLELGGSDPFIVLDDADIGLAGRMAAKARMINAGQSCIAAKRFIVMEKVAEEFKRVFVAELEKLNIGDPMDKATDVGPLAKQEILDTLKDQLEDARQKGAEVIGTGHATSRGLLFPPCALFNVTGGMRVMTEEVFGPVAPVITVQTEDEAVNEANATEYGLGASIWSRDLARAERLARRIDAGCIAINDMVKSDPRLPFGGVKKSGIGRELSHYGLKEFVNIKTVVVKDSDA